MNPPHMDGSCASHMAAMSASLLADTSQGADSGDQYASSTATCCGSPPLSVVESVLGEDAGDTEVDAETMSKLPSWHSSSAWSNEDSPLSQLTGPSEPLLLIRPTAKG